MGRVEAFRASQILDLKLLVQGALRPHASPFPKALGSQILSQELRFSWNTDVEASTLIFVNQHPPAYWLKKSLFLRGFLCDFPKFYYFLNFF